MKVLAGYFTTESNAHVPMKNNITDYVVAFDDECIQKMQVKEVFDQAGIEIPYPQLDVHLKEQGN